MEGLGGDVELGLRRGQVRVVESDLGWPGVFRRLAADLRRALDGLAVAVEHIGSTSVPGLAAKPIIDIAVRLRPRAEVAGVVDVLSPLGYVYRGDAGGDGGLVFVLEDRPDHRLANVHVVRHGDRQWREWLAVRDILRDDAAARHAYAELKHRLADQHPDDRRAYTNGKTSFITWLVGAG